MEAYRLTTADLANLVEAQVENANRNPWQRALQYESITCLHRNLDLGAKIVGVTTIPSADNPLEKDLVLLLQSRAD